MGLWRLVRNPPVSPRRRRFLRFMACWLLLGVVVLCLAPHKRMILALPLLLPGAILAGAEAAHWLGRLPRSRHVAVWTICAVVWIGGIMTYHHVGRNRTKDRIDASAQILTVAAELNRLAGQGVAIGFDDSVPPSLRFFVAGWPTELSNETINTLLSAPAPAAWATLVDQQVVIRRNAAAEGR
jgi:hypothetical protein